MFILYSLITFFGAFLLFQIELIVAQKLLPLYGGGFAIWATCMMFYQIFLLLGYFYAHFLTTSSLRKKAIFQVVLLFLSLFFFPIEFKNSEYFTSPILSIGFLLCKSIGIPFLLLSSTAILQQKWLANNSRLRQSNTPYILYSISNIGSFVALLTYPFLFQPIFELSTQLTFWYILYAAYTLLHLFCLPQKESATPLPTEEILENTPLNKKHILLWLLINTGTCALLIAITNVITMDISPAPILWIFPLAAYLFSFTVVFSEKKFVKPIIIFSSILSGIYFSWLMTHNNIDNSYWFIFYPLFLFTVCCMMNKLLIQLKPKAKKHLSIFYIMLSLGGVFGTVLINFIMPILMVSFPSIFIDLYISIIILLCCIFIHFSERFDFLFRNFWIKGASLLFATLLIFYILPAQIFPRDPALKLSHRNFYGICKIVETDQIRWFSHGSVYHGAQPMDPALENKPFYYYREKGPFDDVFRSKVDAKKVGILGLGTAGLLCYSKKGQYWDFYEIDPDILEIAQKNFTYLKNTPAQTNIYLGDARLELQKAQTKYDILCINAFSGDAIPTHLMTYEAILSYLEKLEDNGLLVIHYSNRYLDLFPVLVKITEKLNLFSAYKVEGNLFIKYHPHIELLIATRSKELQQKIISEYQWKNVKEKKVKAVTLWTDEKVNIIETFNFTSDLDLIPFFLNKFFETIDRFFSLF